MPNKNKPIRQKCNEERNKEVWILKTQDGKIVDKFRGIATLLIEKKKYEKMYFEELIIERDNSILKSMKEALTKNENKRRCNMRPHKIKKGIWYKKCLEKIPENKFYTPKTISRNNFISSYSITDTEKMVLSRNKNHKDINKLCNGLRNMRIKTRTKQKEVKQNKKIKSTSNKEMNRKFEEGLK